jgi:hypothetical protein
MKWLSLALALPLLLLIGGLLINRPPLLSTPGPLKRFITYITTNVAETYPGHEFPELRSPLVPLDAEKTRAAVLEAMHSLGWEKIRETERKIGAVVITPIFRFRDDVTVRLVETANGIQLDARSASRVGKGDLAANARHLRELFAEVEMRTTDYSLLKTPPMGERPRKFVKTSL